MAKERRLKISEVGDVTIVHFRDSRITEELGIQEIGQELADLVEKEGRTKLILNFSAVNFMSSAALGKLISLNKKVKSRSGQLVLCCIRPEIREVFSITKLDQIFRIVEDENQALELLGA